MSVYIVNGAPGAGKTSFEEYVKTIMDKFYCRTISSIDFVKEIAKRCGWKGEKTPESRKFLSDLKKLLIEYNDIVLRELTSEISYCQFDYKRFSIEPVSWAIFIDCREPQEIEKLKKAFNAKTILVSNKEAEARPTSNESDANILNYTYDIIIDNNGTLRDLANAAYDFVKKEGLHLVKNPIVIDMFGNIKILEEDG